MAAKTPKTKKRVKPSRHLELHRFIASDEHTTGALMIDGEFFAFTLEDQHQNVKVSGETRIAAGTYAVGFRKAETPLTKKYQRKFDWFTYHIEIKDVPEFTGIYFHIGNNDDHTAGCVLLGEIADKRGTIGRSTQAFTEFYKMLTPWLDNGEEITLTIY